MVLRGVWRRLARMVLLSTDIDVSGIYSSPRAESRRHPNCGWDKLKDPHGAGGALSPGGAHKPDRFLKIST